MSYKRTHKKVKFQNETYWLHGPNPFTGHYLLSPLDHFDESGELLANPFSDMSYAIIEDGKIMRHGDKIGYVSELKEVTQ